MGKVSSFFKEYLSQGKMVGSIVPSSRFLQRKMTAQIDFEKARCIVELGPGEGCITRSIIKRMGPNTQLLALETHPGFISDFLQFNDPRVHVVNDSAAMLNRNLKELGFEACDYIISSLPLTNFPIALREQIIDQALLSLPQGGIFMQYQYSTVAFKLLKEKFQRVKLGFTPINIPPAFVYTCFK